MRALMLAIALALMSQPAYAGRFPGAVHTSRYSHVRSGAFGHHRWVVAGRREYGGFHPFGRIRFFPGY